ncbi:hypothetical protein BD410DRAFT_521958 [Rickenella mellea]|uniref:Uncharacterized protein n=1 Tax=Rickenella mellea TaxID=50990 RepID=A0A4Y7QFN5_9AGAM|nr:hypothetical protein BD410DRAFT_521958 [Rickenella mellea]
MRPGLCDDAALSAPTVWCLVMIVRTGSRRSRSCINMLRTANLTEMSRSRMCMQRTAMKL